MSAYQADRTTRQGTRNGSDIELSGFTRELGAAWAASYIADAEIQRRRSLRLS